MLTKAVFFIFDQKYSKNSSIVKYFNTHTVY